MLLLTAWLLAAAPVLTLDDALRPATDDPRVVEPLQQALAAREFASGQLVWLAPTLRVEARGDATADPLLAPGSYLISQDTIRRRVAGLEAASAWMSPVGTELLLRLGMAVADSDDPYATIKVTASPRATISVKQHLLRGGGMSARFAAYEGALARADEGSTVSDAQRQSIAAQTAQAYVAAMLAQERVRVRSKSVELGLESKRLSAELVSGGIQSPADLLAAEQGVAERRLELARAQHDLAGARLALESARGATSFAGEWEAVDSIETVSTWCVADFGTPALLEEAAIANDPELAGLIARIRALKANLRARENAALPDLQIGVEATTQGLAGTANCSGGYARDGLTPCSPRAVYVGGPVEALQQAGVAQLYAAGAFASVDLPLWGEPLAAETRSARAEVAAVTARASERTRILRLRIQAATAQAELARLVIAQATLADAAAQAAVAAEAQKLKAGRSTVIDVLRTQDGLLAVAGGRIDALAQLATAVLAVRTATMQLVLGEGAARLACEAGVRP